MIRASLKHAIKTLESVIPSDCKSKNFTASKAQLEILQGIMTEALKKENEQLRKELSTLRMRNITIVLFSFKEKYAVRILDSLPDMLTVFNQSE